MVARDLRRPGYRGLRGYYPSRKAGRSVAFESRLERDHFLLLDADPEVLSFEEQPVTIAFRDATGPRRYTPDVRVRYRDRDDELVEVKYRAELDAMDDEQRLRLREAHEAAQDWARAHRCVFVLRTDAEIVGARLDRARVLHSFARVTANTARIEAVHDFTAARPGVSIDEVVAGLGNDARAVVLHLVWRGRLREEGDVVTAGSTRLFAAEARR